MLEYPATPSAGTDRNRTAGGQGGAVVQEEHRRHPVGLRGGVLPLPPWPLAAYACRPAAAGARPVVAQCKLSKQDLVSKNRFQGAPAALTSRNIEASPA